jgi:hypothetical protein
VDSHLVEPTIFSVTLSRRIATRILAAQLTLHLIKGRGNVFQVIKRRIKRLVGHALGG